MTNAGPPANHPANHPANRDDGVDDAQHSDEIELMVVTMTFDAKATDQDNATLLAVLSKYVVLTRMQDGCRNVDLCSSMTRPGRHLIVQKWDSEGPPKERNYA